MGAVGVGVGVGVGVAVVVVDAVAVAVAVGVVVGDGDGVAVGEYVMSKLKRIAWTAWWCGAVLVLGLLASIAIAMIILPVIYPETS